MRDSKAASKRRARPVTYSELIGKVGATPVLPN